MKHDVIAQLADYRGVLHWNGYTDGGGNVRPVVDLPLYIKEHPIPIRKPKLTEISTVTMLDHQTQRDTGVNVLFWGAPEPLTLTLGGWLLTPVVPVTSGGLTIGHKWSIPEYPTQNISYAELISAYIEGRLNLSAGGAWQRRDPDYYISPYGHQFTNPIITTWEPSYQPNMAKQAFNMTLLLEH